MRRIVQFARYLDCVAILAASVLLAGCGGGGGSNGASVSSSSSDLPQTPSCVTASIVDTGATLSLDNASSVSATDNLSTCSINEYKVELVAGTLYEFKVEGSAAGFTLGNAALALLGPDRSQLKSVDDTWTFTTGFTIIVDPYMGYSAPVTGTYYLQVSGKLQAGSYKLGVARYSIDDMIPAVLFLPSNPMYRWNTGSALGTPISLTYSFMTDASIATGWGISDFSPLTSDDQQAIRKMLASYSAAANITFTEVSDQSMAQFRFGMAANLNGWGVGTHGVTLMRTNDDGSPHSMDIFLALSSFTGAAEGDESFHDWIHEIGHALGLKHPGNYSAYTGTNYGPFVPLGFDNAQYSVMSYLQELDDNFFFANSTPALLDVAAVQYLYGVNLSAQGQTHVSTFSNSQPFEVVVLSSGANDTIDASNQNLPVVINLTAGTFSSIGVNAFGGAARNNVAIPFGATVFDAIGGNGNDIINGNDLDNSITGGPGNDAIDGGSGTNTAMYSGNRANFSVKKTATGFTVMDNTGAEGTDTLTRIQFIRFADTSVAIDINIAVTE